MENNEIKIELNDSEVAGISGGENARIEFGPAPGSKPAIGSPINLIGPYYEDSYASGSAYRAAIGWSGLSVLLQFPDRAAGYAIYQNGGVIGWAPRSSFNYK